MKERHGELQRLQLSDWLAGLRNKAMGQLGVLGCCSSLKGMVLGTDMIVHFVSININ